MLKLNKMSDYAVVILSHFHSIPDRNLNVNQVCKFIGADSLGHLSVDGLFRALGKEKTNYCHGCFTGNYPIDIQLDLDKFVLEGH